jgi:transposase InsO family protein
LFPALAFPTTIDFNIVTDDEASTASIDQIQSNDQPTKTTKNQTEDKQKEGEKETTDNTEVPIKVTFKESEHQKENEQETPTYMDEKHEYMKWHYRILKKMEKTGSKAPLCNDCYSAAACKTPWRRKPRKEAKRNNRELLSPGDIVSVDQLESSTPGFMAQITGALTNKRIVGTAVYVDHASDLSYIYHHTAMTSEETVKGKEAFEQYAKSHGVHIKHYHADNGRFKDREFMKSIERNNQTISYSGVGAHHQHGIAEKRIGDLQRSATTLLLHAQRRWPDAISTYLWPYALRAANDSRSTYPSKQNMECPISKFSQTGRVPKLINQHHFGCPVYVLRKELQDGRKAQKWTDRTRIGINLGYSPRHAHSVSLVLNLDTGLVSPHFHCLYDDMFETTT